LKKTIGFALRKADWFALTKAVCSFLKKPFVRFKKNGLSLLKKRFGRFEKSGFC
jgi:hypothetical protein